MRIIKKAETQVTCKRCTSILGILPTDVSTVSPPGPYDMDYDAEEIGKKYWTCPVCKSTNWVTEPSDDDDYL